MDLNLQPRAAACYVSGRAFSKGDRVVSYLARNARAEVVRFDLLETESASFSPDGIVACRWIQIYKPVDKNENPERALKLTAETLFLTLVDPATEMNSENARLVRFLALMLERKRVLRPKGRTPDGAREIYEHAKSKALHEVPAAELDAAFFRQVQSQLSILVGEPVPKTPEAVSTEPQSPAAPGTV